MLHQIQLIAGSTATVLILGKSGYNRRSFKLKRKRVVNPPEMWIRCDNAFAPIIPLEQFTLALAIIESRHTDLTDEQLLERLRNLLARMGELSGVLIDEAEDMPSSAVYQRRFGGLTRAYPSLAIPHCETCGT